AAEELAIREAKIAIREREVDTEAARMRERGERLRRWEDALEAREQQAETVSKLTSRESTGRAKIGRNERCPCGSGAFTMEMPGQSDAIRPRALNPDFDDRTEPA
ncbi:MAG: hypothetical protein WBN35_03040, partial [Acidimicrobiia bacterium]